MAGLEETYPAFGPKIQKAKQAGFSDEEIQADFQDRIREASKAGFSVDEIGQELGSNQKHGFSLKNATDTLKNTPRMLADLLPSTAKVIEAVKEPVSRIMQGPAAKMEQLIPRAGSAAPVPEIQSVTPIEQKPAVGLNRPIAELLPSTAQVAETIRPVAAGIKEFGRGVQEGANLGLTAMSRLLPFPGIMDAAAGKTGDLGQLLNPLPRVATDALEAIRGKVGHDTFKLAEDILMSGAAHGVAPAIRSARTAINMRRAGPIPEFGEVMDGGLAPGAEAQAMRQGAAARGVQAAQRDALAQRQLPAPEMQASAPKAVEVQAVPQRAVQTAEPAQLPPPAVRPPPRTLRQVNEAEAAAKPIPMEPPAAEAPKQVTDSPKKEPLSVIQEPLSTEFTKEGDEYGRGIIVHPSTKTPGNWQASAFDKRGFAYDEQFKTRQEALEFAQTGGMQPTAKDASKVDQLAKTEDFQKGNEQTRITGMHNELSFKSDNNGAQKVQGIYDAQGFDAAQAYTRERLAKIEAAKAAGKTKPYLVDEDAAAAEVPKEPTKSYDYDGPVSLADFGKQHPLISQKPMGEVTRQDWDTVRADFSKYLASQPLPKGMERAPKSLAESTIPDDTRRPALNPVQEGMEKARVTVETDAAKRTAIRNSINEGETILRGGKKISGAKMTPAEIAAVKRSVAKNYAQLGESPKKPLQVRKGQILEDSEVAVSTFIKRQGGIKIGKDLKEEFGGWNRLNSKIGLPPDEMAEAAHAAGIIPEPTTNALLEGLKAGRKRTRVAQSEFSPAAQEARAAAEQIGNLVDTPADLEFGGKTYTNAVREGEGVRLKDHPDKVLTKAKDIFNVEEKIPFDIPPEPPAFRTKEGETIPASQFEQDFKYGREGTDMKRARARDIHGDLWEQTYNVGGVQEIRRVTSSTEPKFEPTTAGMQGRIPGTEAREVPKGQLKGKRKQSEDLTDLEKASIPDKQRTIADILKSEKGAIRMGPLRMKNGKAQQAPTKDEVTKAVSTLRLNVGNTVEESSKTIQKTMGEPGDQLATKAKAVRDDATLDAGRVNEPLKKIIKKLKETERTNLVDVLEAKAEPISPAVEKAATFARGALKSIANKAEFVGLKIKNPITGEKIPWQPRSNFFPHMFKEEFSHYAKSETGKAEIKASIKERMPGATDAEVQKRYDDIMTAARTRYGHLEMARVFDRPDYLKDPRVLQKYITDSYRRLHIAAKFGPEMEKGETLLSKIGQKYGDSAESFAREYMQRATDTEEGGNIAFKNFSRTMRNLHAGTKLGQAVIANSSQSVFTAVYAGPWRTVKGAAAAMTKDGRAFGNQILNDSVLDFLKEGDAYYGRSGAAGKFADTVMKYTGFTTVEKMNRIVAANTGKYLARDMFEKLDAHPESKKYRAGLEKLRVNVDKALEEGKLSETDELRAGQSVVNKTQFQVDVTELPLAWSTDAGRLITQFKSFQFKAGQFVKDEIVKQAARGNIKPLLIAAILFPAAGFAVMNAKDAIRFGDQREEEPDILDYLATVGTFGAFTDAFATSGRQPVRGLQQLAGPTLGDAGALWEAASAITNPRKEDPDAADRLRPMAKFLARQVPVAGPSLRNLFNEPKSELAQKKADTDKKLKELGIIKPKKVSREKKLRELGLR
jgi:soluble cytochrome b562/ribosomal protein S18